MTGLMCEKERRLKCYHVEYGCSLHGVQEMHFNNVKNGVVKRIGFQ